VGHALESDQNHSGVQDKDFQPQTPETQAQMEATSEALSGYAPREAAAVRIPELHPSPVLRILKGERISEDRTEEPFEAPGPPSAQEEREGPTAEPLIGGGDLQATTVLTTGLPEEEELVSELKPAEAAAVPLGNDEPLQYADLHPGEPRMKPAVSESDPKSGPIQPVEYEDVQNKAGRAGMAECEGAAIAVPGVCPGTEEGGAGESGTEGGGAVIDGDGSGPGTEEGGGAAIDDDGGGPGTEEGGGAAIDEDGGGPGTEKGGAGEVGTEGGMGAEAASEWGSGLYPAATGRISRVSSEGDVFETAKSRFQTGDRTADMAGTQPSLVEEDPPVGRTLPGLEPESEPKDDPEETSQVTDAPLCLTALASPTTGVDLGKERQDSADDVDEVEYSDTAELAGGAPPMTHQAPPLVLAPVCEDISNGQPLILLIRHPPIPA
jgi:hypothetical protein